MPPVKAVERQMRMSPLLAAGNGAHSGKPMVTALALRATGGEPAARAPGEVQGAAPLWAVQQVLSSLVRSSGCGPGWPQGGAMVGGRCLRALRVFTKCARSPGVQPGVKSAGCEAAPIDLCKQFNNACCE